MADGTLKISLCAAPEKNRANKELVEYLSGFFDVPKKDIEIATGVTGRLKTIRLRGISVDEFEKRLIDIPS